MSKSDILGPIAYLSDIEILVSFKRAMFEEYSFKYRTKIFLLFMSDYHIEVNAWSIMIGVHDTNMGDTFLSIQLGLV